MEPYNFRDASRKVCLIQFVILSWSLISLAFVVIFAVILTVVAVSGTLNPFGMVGTAGIQTAQNAVPQVGEMLPSPAFQIARGTGGGGGIPTTSQDPPGTSSLEPPGKAGAQPGPQIATNNNVPETRESPFPSPEAPLAPNVAPEIAQGTILDVPQPVGDAPVTVGTIDKAGVQLAPKVGPEIGEGAFAGIPQPVGDAPKLFGTLANAGVETASTGINKASGILSWPIFQTGTTIVVVLLLLYCVIYGLVIIYLFVCNVKLFKASQSGVDPDEAIGQVRDWECATITFTVISAVMCLLTWSLYQGVQVVCLNVLALHVVGKYREELKREVKEDVEKL